jgi:hypothetical protein
MTGPSLTFVRSDFTFNAETPSPKVRETLMERRDLVRYPPKSVDEELFEVRRRNGVPFSPMGLSLLVTPGGRLVASFHLRSKMEPSVCM